MTGEAGTESDVEPILTEKELREVYHSVNDAIYIVDSEANVIDVNEAATDMYGYSRQEFRSGDVGQTSAGEEPYTNENARQKARLAMEGEPQVFEWKGKDKQGNVFWEEVSLSRMFVDDEVRVLSIVRRIDERKRYELELEAAKRELKQQNERLDQFASMVSHDLRNPLGIADTYLDFAEETGDTADFDAVHDALDRMDEMIDSLLTIARTKTTIEETESLSLQTLVNQAWETAQTGDADLQASETLDLTIEGDPELLQNVFENLFRNSVDHNDSPLTVTVGKRDDETGFYIADDGSGIPETEREDVFDQGYTTRDDGTGFGLAIVDEFVTAHGWEITITESLDGGARFDILTDG